MSGIFTKVRSLPLQYPLIRGMVSYALIWPTCSVVQEYLAHGTTLEEANFAQAARFGLFGTFFMAPVFYGWMKYSGKFFKSHSIKTAIIRAAVEQVTYAPLAMIFFFFGMSLLEFKPIHICWNEVLEKFWPTYKIGVIFWPAIQTFNFYCISERNRIVFVSAASFVWTIYLAHMKAKEQTVFEIKELVNISENIMKPKVVTTVLDSVTRVSGSLSGPQGEAVVPIQNPLDETPVDTDKSKPELALKTEEVAIVPLDLLESPVGTISNLKTEGISLVTPVLVGKPIGTISNLKTEEIPAAAPTLAKSPVDTPKTEVVLGTPILSDIPVDNYKSSSPTTDELIIGTPISTETPVTPPITEEVQDLRSNLDTPKTEGIAQIMVDKPINIVKTETGNETAPLATTIVIDIPIVTEVIKADEVPAQAVPLEVTLVKDPKQKSQVIRFGTQILDELTETGLKDDIDTANLIVTDEEKPNYIVDDKETKDHANDRAEITIEDLF